MNYAHSAKRKWNLKRSLKNKPALVVGKPFSLAVCARKWIVKIAPYKIY